MKFTYEGLIIEERPTGRNFYGEYVWPAAIVMCEFLKNLDIKGKRILELGSGTGICGIYAAKLGAHHVTLTDFIDWNIENIIKNIKMNKLEKLTDPLWFKWGTSLNDQWDMIIGSDITYPTSDFYSILKTIKTHLKPGGKAILAHVIRPFETQIFTEYPDMNCLIEHKNDRICSQKFKILASHEVTDVNIYSNIVKNNSPLPMCIKIIEMENL